jgi:uncharacterized protein (DUF427 family)
MDPQGHHIQLHEDPRRVEVAIDGEVLASSSRAVVLSETGLPPRHYFPRDDVHLERLRPTSTETVCPFKGQASYWSADIGGTTHGDVAWSYVTPIDGMEQITELICFYAERTDMTIDGIAQERPESPWSKSASAV